VLVVDIEFSVNDAAAALTNSVLFLEYADTSVIVAEDIALSVYVGLVNTTSVMTHLCLL
jgi:hypothetical protein